MRTKIGNTCLLAGALPVLQNVRLYSIGVVLNAAYFLHSGGRLEGFLSDMRGPHFAVVLVLALMGLITVGGAFFSLTSFMCMVVIELQFLGAAVAAKHSAQGATSSHHPAEANMCIC